MGQTSGGIKRVGIVILGLCVGPSSGEIDACRRNPYNRHAGLFA